MDNDIDKIMEQYESVMARCAERDKQSAEIIFRVRKMIDEAENQMAKFDRIVDRQFD